VAENLDRIRSFFDSVFDSMNEALRGNTEGVANKIIVGLKTGIVLALDFLAKQIGLDNVIDSVQKIIKSLRKPIVNAIELVIKKASKVIKSAGKLFGIGRGKKKGSLEEEEEVATGDNEVSNVIKLRAAESLDKRLKDIESFENIQKAVTEVRSELGPKLKTLELEYFKEDDSYKIFASASIKSELAKLKKLGPKRQQDPDKVKEENYKGKHKPTAMVVMKSKVTLLNLPDEKQDIKGLRPFTPSTGHPQQDTGEFGPKEEDDLMNLNPSTHPHKRTMTNPGVAWVNEENKQLHFATFNTGGNIEGTVESHAESGFIDNFHAFLKEHKNTKIKNIKVNITHSPCSGCANLLSALFENFNDSKSEDTELYIAWEEGFITRGEPYQSYENGERTIETRKAGTTLADVQKLKSGGWQISRNSIQKVSDIVQKFQGRAESKKTQEEAEKLKLQVSIAPEPSVEQPRVMMKRVGVERRRKK